MIDYYIYARYSSELQNPKSCEDQIALCTEYVTRQGGRIRQTYQDDGISGRTMDRPGVQELLKRIKIKGRCVIVCESLDRLSRDQEDIASIYKITQFYEAKIITLSEGEIKGLQIGVNGYLSQEYSVQLGAKTLRGQKNRAKEGFHSGPPPFGYRVRREYDERGELIKGLREIDPDEAAIVIEVYQRYVDGEPVSRICRDLNARGIVTRKGNPWRSNSIMGHKARESGMFHNPIYRGVMLYNRQSFKINPETQKKVPRPKDESEKIYTPDESLRIIPEDLWQRMNLLRQSRELAGGNREINPLTPRLFCQCGTGLHIYAKGVYRCPNSKNCGCNRSIKTSIIIEEAIKQIKEGIQKNGKIYLNELHTKAKEQQAIIESEINDIRQKISRLLDYVSEGRDTAETRLKIERLEQKKARLQLRIATKITSDRDVLPLYERLDRMTVLHSDTEMQKDLADLLIRITVHKDHRMTVEPNYDAMFQWLITHR